MASFRFPCGDDPHGILSNLLPGNGVVSVNPEQLLETLSLAVILPPLRDGGVSRGGEPGGGVPVARPSEDLCVDCSSRLKLLDNELGCPSCLRLYEPPPPEDDEKDRPTLGRLKIVGVNSNWFQSELDRSKPATSPKDQIRLNYEEMLRWNKEFANKKDSHGNNYGPIPLNVLQDVASDYYLVQQQGVKRSLKKRAIIAALVSRHCIAHGFTRTRTEIATFAGLRGNRIARGNSALHAIIDDKKSGIYLDVNADKTAPHIASAFSRLGLDDEKYEPLRKAVFEIVKIAEEAQIGIQSNLSSKVVATTFDVVSRTESKISLAAVADRCKIRKHTLSRFLASLRDYRSYFVDVYKKYGLKV